MNPQQKRYGDYELLDFCAEGGFGEVWRARGFDGRIVALKIVGTQYRGDAWKSELKGIQTYQQTVPAHPNLLQIFHVGEAENCFYYTMELADSLSEAGYCADTLAERLKRNGRLNADETLKLVGSLLSGVEALHASGLIHRDIKPANILWVKGVPKLADVGLVRDPAHTVSRGGTPAFFPPESGSSGSSADDFYALSMVVYCALTGFGPERFPEIPTGLPLSEYAALRNVFMRGCSSKAEERFHSANEFREMLTVPIPPARRILPARYWIYAAIALFLLLAATLGFVWFFSRAPEQPQFQPKLEQPPKSAAEMPPEVNADEEEQTPLPAGGMKKEYPFFKRKTQALNDAYRAMLPGRKTGLQNELKSVLQRLEMLPNDKIFSGENREKKTADLNRQAEVLRHQLKELDRLEKLPADEFVAEYERLFVKKQ